LLLFLQKKKILFFFEKRPKKVFIPGACPQRDAIAADSQGGNQ
jgi:hypothetical protein